MKIKIYRVNRLEEEISELLTNHNEAQARVIGSVVRDMLGVIERKDKKDETKFCVGGTIYKMTLEREN